LLAPLWGFGTSNLTFATVVHAPERTHAHAKGMHYRFASIAIGIAIGIGIDIGGHFGARPDTDSNPEISAIGSNRAR
jgi:hypothetical protein